MTAAPSAVGVLVRLLADLDGQRRRERQAYAEGYRDGHRSGWDVGYAHACHEMATEWAKLRRVVRGTAAGPSHAELEHRRWQGRRADFGRPRPGDHPGGPVQWGVRPPTVPVRPLRADHPPHTPDRRSA
ncbi:FliH/SctL family protein [Sphaerisporangium aureirubrum]|uniref:Uncharacterized protein n=1 Tax=Sphaerisporangium aureirubrum TaxID=1544736 RepID=A0ABW1NBJ6_9ACTN